MDGPSRMCISENKILITQWMANSLNVCSIEGKLLQSVGSEGDK